MSNLYRSIRNSIGVTAGIIILAVLHAIGLEQPASAIVSLPAPPAVVSANLTELVVKNNSNHRWCSGRILLNGKFFYPLVNLNPSQIERIPLSRFATCSGEQFQPFKCSPQAVEIEVSGYDAPAMFSF